MLEGLELLDENENEQLYRLENALFNTVALVVNGEEFVLVNMQDSDFPLTLADAMYYNWLPLAEVLSWHP